ncbi:MAG: tRNA (guanosine(37)-N1)-methyltransferase TrmD [Butyrivibrio sp.]|nr:tRNA (guanosine(37)-N1)-methyltransferase TrmD [Butyrivibrio sp.]
MTNFHVLTLFPKTVLDCLGESITGRAARKGLITVRTTDIRDFSDDKHGHVDDYPYGGGAGMVMRPEPIYRAYQSAIRDTEGEARVIYLTPQGRLFNQSMAEELAKVPNLIFLCGHYEGVDERVLNRIVTDYVSIGDYVLTGGELPAMVMIDAISRKIPGVLGNDSSSEIETFYDNLLEYPQYTRPEVFEGESVPEVLLSGHHANIAKWRREKSLERTCDNRPELLAGARLDESDKRYLEEYRKAKR